jgi:DNA recombination protein RmuC
MQLRRVVELAGMLEHCDFSEQATARDADGGLLRPDLVVRMPGGKHVVVDAKAPLAAYLDAIEAADDDLRRLKLVDHARQVRDHVGKLGAKAYWQQFAPAPEFVVMFLPDESFFRAALEQDPSLIEAGARAGVVFASPTTLIGLLRAIAFGWQQETVAESARAVHELGRELYGRLGVMARHFAKVGKSLDSAVGAYNETVGSLERRVLVQARRFEAHGVSGEIAELEPLDRRAQPLQAPELIESLENVPRALDAA